MVGKVLHEEGDFIKNGAGLLLETFEIFGRSWTSRLKKAAQSYHRGIDSHSFSGWGDGMENCQVLSHNLGKFLP